MRKRIVAVAATTAILTLTGCRLSPIGWHGDGAGGTMEWAAVDDTKEGAVKAARVAFSCRDPQTGDTYRQTGTLVDADTGVGRDPRTGTFRSSGMCRIGDARSSSVYYWVVRW